MKPVRCFACGHDEFTKDLYGNYVCDDCGSGNLAYITQGGTEQETLKTLPLSGSFPKGYASMVQLLADDMFKDELSVPKRQTIGEWFKQKELSDMAKGLKNNPDPLLELFNSPPPPDPYVSLWSVLDQALIQASRGKGKERHANEGEYFEKQVICEVRRRVGSGYTLGQAVKKIYESQRLEREAGVRELLGAIVYIAAEIIVAKEEKNGDS